MRIVITVMALAISALLVWNIQSDSPLNSGLIIRYQVDPSLFQYTHGDLGRSNPSGVSIHGDGTVMTTCADGSILKGRLDLAEIEDLLEKVNALDVFNLSEKDLEPPVRKSRPDYYWQISRRSSQPQTLLEITLSHQSSRIEVSGLEYKMEEFPQVDSYRRIHQAIQEIVSAAEMGK
jgi:hypothetical protein